MAATLRACARPVQPRMPVEHGAWGLLGVPFFCAAAVAQSWNLPLLLAGVVVLCVFLLRGSLEQQDRWTAVFHPFHLALVGTAAICGAALIFVFERTALLPVALVGATLYALQLGLLKLPRKDRTEKRSLPVELAGVAILTLTAPVATLAARGALDARGIHTWLLNLLFFLGGVLYVKYRVRGIQAHRQFEGLAMRLWFAWPVLIFHFLLVVLVSACVWLDSLPVAALAAIAPGAARAGGLLWHLGGSFPIRRLGWTEVAHSVAFAVLLVLAFRFED